MSQFFIPVFNAVILTELSPFHQLQKKLYDIDMDYFEKIPAWTERIPSKLDFKLKSDIIADFNKLADHLQHKIHVCVCCAGFYFPLFQFYLLFN